MERPETGTCVDVAWAFSSLSVVVLLISAVGVMWTLWIISKILRLFSLFSLLRFSVFFKPSGVVSCVLVVGNLNGARAVGGLIDVYSCETLC